ncbi:MAG TPA: nucleoside hydrolase [Candidatus Limnocylindrales bacterium]|nr:nucleoside hydrolase [Candidatus Limnocylindrales bacterium]
MGPRLPLILDVDTGIDDSLALLLAAVLPEVELVAVTTVAGNVGLAAVDENTRAVLELAGVRGVPVARGRDRPLRKALATAEDTHGPRGIGHAELPPATLAVAAQPAAETIVELARSRPGEITLVTLGPLTNLAVALDREPALPSLLRGWTLMGGAYRTPGNTTPTAEWNIYVDPDAAATCFAAWAQASTAGPESVGTDAGVPRPLAMGLDVTEQARLLPEHLRHLALRAGARPQDAELLAHEPLSVTGTVADDPIVRFIVDALRFYFEFHARSDGFYGAFVHDPFAVAATVDRGLVRTVPAFVDVETGSGPAHAMTVTDWRHLTGRGPNVDVAVDGDAPAFLRLLVERLGGLAADRSGVAR